MSTLKSPLFKCSVSTPAPPCKLANRPVAPSQINLSDPAPSRIRPSTVELDFNVTVALPAPSSINKPCLSMMLAPLLRLIATLCPAFERVSIAACEFALFMLLPAALMEPPTSIVMVPVPSCFA